MLTAVELASLRNETELWFDATCDIYVITSNSDAYGGRDRTHGVTPTYTSIPCMVEPGAGQNQEMLGLATLEEMQMFTVTVPALTTISVGDHVVVHKGTENLHLYVRAMQGPESFETDRRLVCSEVGSPAPHL